MTSARNRSPDSTPAHPLWYADEVCTWRAGRFEPGCLSFKCDNRFIAAKAGADPEGLLCE
ncbi:hypothetical protein [Corynebacterium variabile]|uniref:hypothetical protein n=1 Tax=Corynebacterium variabile TaxID=1727 RepID=UPI0028A1053B|nr:hypothetical protein [Corynebacterium variabile]